MWAHSKELVPLEKFPAEGCQHVNLAVCNDKRSISQQQIKSPHSQSRINREGRAGKKEEAFERKHSKTLAFQIRVS